MVVVAPRNTINSVGGRYSLLLPTRCDILMAERGSPRLEIGVGITGPGGGSNPPHISKTLTLGKLFVR
jgi:hypothetical protein